MTTKANLTETQRQVLERAADHALNEVVWFPDNVKGNARSKVLAFVVGAFFAGTAGAALAQYEGYVSPSYYDFMQSVELVVIVTLAGAGSITGTILVAVILTWLPEQLRGFEEYRMIVYSLLLITLMLVRPNGLLGNRELLLGGRSNANAAS